jgi:hypothetical protein
MPLFMNKLSFDTNLYILARQMNFYSFLLLILQKSWGGGGQEWQEGRETQIILNVLVLQCYTTHIRSASSPCIHKKSANSESAVREDNQGTRKTRERQKTNEMRDCA